MSMGFAVSDEVSSTFQGPPGLDGMKVSDPRDDPVFTIDYYLLIRTISARVSKINAGVRSGVEREKRARVLGRDVCPAMCADVRQVSSYFQGAQGEPGTKGERGDPGLPVSPLSSIYAAPTRDTRHLEFYRPVIVRFLGK